MGFICKAATLHAFAEYAGDMAACMSTSTATNTPAHSTEARPLGADQLESTTAQRQQTPSHPRHDEGTSVDPFSFRSSLPSTLPPFESILMQALDYRLVPKSIEIEAHNICYEAPSAASNILGRVWYEHTHDGPAYAHHGDRHIRPLILKHVSCIARSGEILAIAGPSGAGKSTLLEVLAGQRHPAAGSGKILVNKQEVSATTFRRISGFVSQSDVLFPRLTVRETLLFSANMRLPASESVAEKAEKVSELIAELGLTHVADARVGGQDMRGISGGERRRVSIGVDVIHDPLVLLLDEPTSGLDSVSAFHVIKMLHSMAKMRSRTIIISIHQPSYRIIQQFNALLLLAKGAVVHHGSLEMLQHRLRADGHTIPAQVNILEYALEAISTGALAAKPTGSPPSKTQHPHSHTGSINSCSTLQIVELSQNQDRHQVATCIGTGYIGPRITGLSHELGSATISTTASNSSISTASSVMSECSMQMQSAVEKPSFANNRSREVAILAQRFLRNLLRARKLMLVRTLQALVTGIGLGSIYMNVGMNEKGVAERLGFFAFTLTFLISTSIEDLPIFLHERNVLVMEISRGSYRVTPYVVANLLIFLPFLLIVALLYSLPVYFLIGLSSMTFAFFSFVLIVWMVLVMANSFVGFVSALAPDFTTANSLISGWMGVSFLFSGYFISRDSMPVYWRFMHYISMFKYPLDGLLINEYSSLQAQNKCFQASENPPPSHEHVSSCFLSPSAVLQKLGLYQTPLWYNTTVIFSFLACYRLLFYILLRMKASKRDG